MYYTSKTRKMIKKRNLFTVNLSKHATECLIMMGYLNKQKKSTGQKNMSKYISKLITEDVSITYPLDNRKIQENVLKQNLREWGNKRDSIERKMIRLAESIKKIKAKEIEKGNIKE